MTVNSNGTSAKTNVKGDDFFQNSKITQFKSMAPTEQPVEGWN